MNLPRKALDAIASFTNYSQCGHCHRPWNMVKTNFNFAKHTYLAAMCDDCWTKTSPDERVAAFSFFMDRATKRGSNYINRAEILAAVSAQPEGPLRS